MWGGVGGYVVVGYRVGGCRVEGGVSGKFPRNFPETPGNFPEISRKFRRGPYVKTDIVTRELKIF